MVSTRQKIKIRIEVNHIEIKHKKIEMVNETRTWVFGRIDKVDKTINRLKRKNREKIQINRFITVEKL